MICPDCKGFGQYQGLLSVETCQKCAGTGQIGVISCEQVDFHDREVVNARTVEVTPTESWEVKPEIFEEDEKEALLQYLERFQSDLQKYLVLQGLSEIEAEMGTKILSGFWDEETGQWRLK